MGLIMKDDNREEYIDYDMIMSGLDQDAMMTNVIVNNMMMIMVEFDCNHIGYDDYDIVIVIRLDHVVIMKLMLSEHSGAR